MNLYFFASHVYQFAYSFPIYQKLGGTFVVPKITRYVQFINKVNRLSLTGFTSKTNGKIPVLKRHFRSVLALDGILISNTNSDIHKRPKNCITVFMGHGTGDKKYGGTKQYSGAQLLSRYDYHFITGPKHLQKLRDVGLEMSEDKLIKIGNVRFDRYVNKEIDVDREYNRLGIVDRERKNVLYAPTWEYGNGTFNTYFERFAKQLTRQYNLIIRPHYHDRNKIMKSQLWAVLNRIKHLYFSDPAELVNDSMIKDFVLSDIMISDTSSILYEYLITGKPIIIAANNYDDLHQMPDQMNIVNYATIFDGSGNIEEIVAEELAEQKYRHDYRRLLESCFYFNDGKSIQRVRDFLLSQNTPG